MYTVRIRTVNTVVAFDCTWYTFVCMQTLPLDAIIARTASTLFLPEKRERCLLAHRGIEPFCGLKQIRRCIIACNFPLNHTPTMLVR